MVEIDDIINDEVGQFCRFYYGHAFAYFIIMFVNASQIFLIMFGSVPMETLAKNPHANNETNLQEYLHLSKDQESYVTGFLQSIFFVGFMIGAVLFGQLADKYGRRWMGWKIHVMLVVTNAFTYHAKTWQQLTVFRIIGGMGIGGETVINTILFQEFCSSKLWAINGNVSEFSFTIMMLIYMLFGYYFPGWKSLSSYSTIPIIVGFVFYMLTPESPRWLYSQGRCRDAEQVMNKVARRNQNYRVDYSNTLQIKTSTKSQKYSFVDVFKDPVLRYRCLIFAYIWCTTSFVFYCITLAAGAFSPHFYTAFAFSSLSQLPAIPLCLYLMERKWCGRRGALSILMLIVALPMFVMFLVPNIPGNSSMRLWLSMISKMGATGCFDLIYIYTPELFPTVVRNISLGMLTTAARIGSIVAPYFANITLHHDSGAPFLLYAALCTVGAYLALRLPETRGQKIVNTIEEAHQQEMNIPAKKNRTVI